MNQPALLGSVVEPTRVIDPRTASVAQVGEVLKHLIGQPGTYHTEEDQRLAYEAVDAFKRAFSEGSPDVREEHRAALEDVSTRIPPGGPSVVVSRAPAIDYNALARAMILAQRELDAADKKAEG